MGCILSRKWILNFWLGRPRVSCIDYPLVRWAVITRSNIHCIGVDLLKARSAILEKQDTGRWRRRKRRIWRIREDGDINWSPYNLSHISIRSRRFFDPSRSYFATAKTRPPTPRRHRNSTKPLFPHAPSAGVAQIRCFHAPPLPPQ